MKLSILKEQVKINELPDASLLSFDFALEDGGAKQLICSQLMFRLPYICVYKAKGDYGMLVSESSEKLEIVDEIHSCSSNTDKYLLSSLYITRDYEPKYVEYYKLKNLPVKIHPVLQGVYRNKVMSMFYVKDNLYLRKAELLLNIVTNDTILINEQILSKYEQVLINEDYYVNGNS